MRRNEKKQRKKLFFMGKYDIYVLHCTAKTLAKHQLIEVMCLKQDHLLCPSQVSL